MSQYVDYRETLVVYLRSNTIEEAAQALKLSETVLKSRLASMRKAGVNLPRKDTRLSLNNDLFVAQLNSLVNKHK